MSLRTLFFALATVSVAAAFAQDSLFYSNGNVIVGQVEEIGIDVVKYRTNSDGRSVLIEVNKQDLSSLKLKGGQAYSFTSTGADAQENAAFLSRKHALSVDVIAPALNHLTIGYEQVIAPRMSLVAKVGYIGLWNPNRESNDVYGNKGALLSAGVKFILPRSAKRTAALGDTHPLAGWYLRPELVFSTFKRTYSYYPPYNPYNNYYYYSPETYSSDYTNAAVILSIGRELFLGEHITFDISGGLGYGMQWRDGNTENGLYGYNDQQYAYTHTFLGNTAPLVVSGGLRFGYAF